MARRPWRRCASCGGVCHWADTDWVCDDCGDEWGADHGPQYDAPADDAPPVQHYPIDAPPDDPDDWRVCACGNDLYSQSVCPEVPAAPCGCPEWSTGVDHIPGLCEPVSVA